MALHMHKTCKQCGNDVEVTSDDLTSLQLPQLSDDSRLALKMVLRVGILIIAFTLTCFAGCSVYNRCSPTEVESALKDPKASIEIEYEKGYESKRKITRPGQ